MFYLKSSLHIAQIPVGFIVIRYIIKNKSNFIWFNLI